MEDWREAVWRAVPEGAEPERFAARRGLLLEHVRPASACSTSAAATGPSRPSCSARAARWRWPTSPARRCGGRARGRPAAEAVRLAEGAPLPFAEDAFDVVWAGEVLEHVADVVGLLAEVRRVLRWGGRLLVTTPWHGRLVVATDAHFDPRADHLRFFSARTLRAVLADAGFPRVAARAAGTPRALRAGAPARRALSRRSLRRWPAGRCVIASCERGSR